MAYTYEERQTLAEETLIRALQRSYGQADKDDLELTLRIAMEEDDRKLKELPDELLDTKKDDLITLVRRLWIADPAICVNALVNYGEFLDINPWTEKETPPKETTGGAPTLYVFHHDPIILINPTVQDWVTCIRQHSQPE